MPYDKYKAAENVEAIKAGKTPRGGWKCPSCEAVRPKLTALQVHYAKKHKPPENHR